MLNKTRNLNKTRKRMNLVLSVSNIPKVMPNTTKQFRWTNIYKCFQIEVNVCCWNSIDAMDTRFYESKLWNLVMLNVCVSFSLRHHIPFFLPITRMIRNQFSHGSLCCSSERITSFPHLLCRILFIQGIKCTHDIRKHCYLYSAAVNNLTVY